jgi:hypothetical protein
MGLTKGRPDGTLAQLSVPNSNVNATTSCVPVFINDERVLKTVIQNASVENVRKAQKE